jgi:hypothetical protein
MGAIVNQNFCPKKFYVKNVNICQSSNIIKDNFGRLKKFRPNYWANFRAKNFAQSPKFRPTCEFSPNPVALERRQKTRTADTQKQTPPLSNLPDFRPFSISRRLAGHSIRPDIRSHE